MCLLGAGASADAGLLISSKLGDAILVRLRSGRQTKLAHVLDFVVAVMVAHDVRTGEATSSDRPDIERIASAVELLSKRSGLEVAPFIEAWDGAIESFETHKSSRSVASDLGRALSGRHGILGASSPDTWALERAINQMIDNRVGVADNDIFQKLLAVLVHELQQLLEIEDAANFDYLAPLLRSITAAAPEPTVATLNYDLGVEVAAERAGINVARGVDTWTETGKLHFPSSHLRLLKLHGSLDWAKVPNWRGISGASLTVGRGDDGSETPPFLVFGQREKLRSEGPFLQLLEEFRRTLDEHNQLLVLGYAFRDPHVNDIVGRWLESRSESRMVVVDPYYAPPEHLYGGALTDYRSQLVRWTREPQTDRSAKVAWAQTSVKDFARDVEARGLEELIAGITVVVPSTDDPPDDSASGSPSN